MIDIHKTRNSCHFPIVNKQQTQVMSKVRIKIYKSGIIQYPFFFLFNLIEGQ